MSVGRWLSSGAPAHLQFSKSKGRGMKAANNAFLLHVPANFGSTRRSEGPLRYQSGSDEGASPQIAKSQSHPHQGVMATVERGNREIGDVHQFLPITLFPISLLAVASSNHGPQPATLPCTCFCVGRKRQVSPRHLHRERRRRSAANPRASNDFDLP